MVAGENAQATGIVGQHLGDAELHREVRDAVGQFCTLFELLLVPERTGQIIVQLSGQFVEPTDKGFIRCKLVEPFGADLSQQRDRVVSDLLPELRIDRREQVLGRLVP